MVRVTREQYEFYQLISLSVNKIGAILSPNNNEVIIVVQDHLDRVFTLGDSLACTRTRCNATCKQSI